MSAGLLEGREYFIHYRQAQRYTKGTGSLLYSSDYLAQTVGVGRGPGIRVMFLQPTQHIFRFSTLVHIHAFGYLLASLGFLIYFLRFRSVPLVIHNRVQ